jgi:MFS family permease
VRSGLRRYLVALCLFLTAAGLLIPYVESLAAIIVLISITVSFANTGPAANATLTSDLLRSPADAGRAFAFLVLGGNVFGLLAPIVTGYLVEASGSFSSAFIAGGVLALTGAVVTLMLSRGTIGDTSNEIATKQLRAAG